MRDTKSKLREQTMRCHLKEKCRESCKSIHSRKILFSKSNAKLCKTRSSHNRSRELARRAVSKSRSNSRASCRDFLSGRSQKRKKKVPRIKIQCHGKSGFHSPLPQFASAKCDGLLRPEPPSLEAISWRECSKNPNERNFLSRRFRQEKSQKSKAHKSKMKQEEN